MIDDGSGREWEIDPEESPVLGLFMETNMEYLRLIQPNKNKPRRLEPDSLRGLIVGALCASRSIALASNDKIKLRIGSEITRPLEAAVAKYAKNKG